MLCRLFPQDQSDIQIECSSEDRLATQRICNISAPFMKSLSQVGQSYFHSNYDFGMKKGSTTCSFLFGYYCCPDTTALLFRVMELLLPPKYVDRFEHHR